MYPTVIGERPSHLQAYGPVFTHSPEAVLVSHLADGRIVAANAAACALFGMTEAEICQAGRAGLCDPADTRLPVLVAICTRERRVSGEAWLLRKGGRRFLASLKVVALPDDTTFVFVQDVTTRKRAEAALGQAEARYHGFFARNAAGTFQGRLDLETGTLWRLDCNQRHAEILGYPSIPAALAEPVAACFPSEDAYRTQLARLLQDGQVTDYEVEVRRKDGTPVWVAVSASLTREGDGRTAFTEGSLIDITERKQAEASLREREERLRSHVENSPLAVVEWDAKFIVTRWAGAAERMFGWTAAETVGKPIMDLQLIHPSDRPIVERVMARLTDGATRKITSSNRNVTKDGRLLYCSWYNSVLLDPRGQMASVLSLVLDNTAQVEGEAQLRRALAENESALATNQTLLREVHHRTKNNLQMLCDLLFLQAASLPSAEAKAVLEDAYGRVFAIARLHEQLYQSITSGEIRLAEYLDRLVVGCAEVHPDVRILLDAPDHQLALDVDRAIHLGLVVNELMLNAIKHAFTAGEQGEVRVAVRRVGDDVELQVRDTGKGLPPDFTIEAAASLGLRIVNVLAQRLRASVRMENAGGAAFAIRFPLHADESVEPR